MIRVETNTLEVGAKIISLLGLLLFEVFFSFLYSSVVLVKAIKEMFNWRTV